MRVRRRRSIERSARRPSAAAIARPPIAEGDVVVVACGMIARELRAVCAQAGLHHLKLWCLPADWHFHPDRIADGVRSEAVRARAGGASAIFVAYADCGTGGQLDAVCRELGIERLPGAHCFSFYQGAKDEAKRAQADLATFYVTDFLARQPDAFLWKPLGLDRHPELADSYFGAYERIVFLSQSDDAALTKSAEGIAARLGLPFEQRHTGYGDLAAILPNWNAALSSDNRPQ